MICNWSTYWANTLLFLAWKHNIHPIKYHKVIVWQYDLMISGNPGAPDKVSFCNLNPHCVFSFLRTVCTIVPAHTWGSCGLWFERSSGEAQVTQWVMKCTPGYSDHWSTASNTPELRRTVNLHTRADAETRVLVRLRFEQTDSVNL